MLMCLLLFLIYLLNKKKVLLLNPVKKLKNLMKNFRVTDPGGAEVYDGGKSEGGVGGEGVEEEVVEEGVAVATLE
ncbi:hypothetical protein HYC85_004128 [Camellia sinensis]|uniref:Uncharacterized protein n=1 Tax=Camellia sinensis TaxID=4442 RepID=A0A7J7HVM1_CAMSI|nr:hypothetical protein HYC85_004128 [Camellia sinensis]